MLKQNIHLDYFLNHSTDACQGTTRNRQKNSVYQTHQIHSNSLEVLKFYWSPNMSQLCFQAKVIGTKRHIKALSEIVDEERIWVYGIIQIESDQHHCPSFMSQGVIC